MEKSIHVIARGIVIKDEKILLCVNTTRQFYYLPGGHVEHSESAATALEREMHEELGVACTVQRFIGCFEYTFIPDNPNKCHNHEYNLLFALDAPELVPARKPVPQEESIAFEWVSLSTLEALNFKPVALRKPLRSWLQAEYHGAFSSAIEAQTKSIA